MISCRGLTIGADWLFVAYNNLSIYIILMNYYEI